MGAGKSTMRTMGPWAVRALVDIAMPDVNAALEMSLELRPDVCITPDPATSTTASWDPLP